VGRVLLACLRWAAGACGRPRGRLQAEQLIVL
jgi:hypothetical protein